MSEPIGLAIIRHVTNPDWLRQPDQDMRLFRDAPCTPAYWKTAQPAWRYDKRSAHLACASSVKLGVGEYRYAAERKEIASLVHPGLCYLESSDAREWFTDRGFRHADKLPCIPGGWVHTPILRLYHQMGIEGTVSASYTWQEYHAVLAPTYYALKDLRKENEAACKWLYRKTFGILAHWPMMPDGVTPREKLWNGCIYRPDWYNLLKAELKARMYYHVWRVWEIEGVWPVSMHVDELGYDQQVTSLRLGDGIGAFSEHGPACACAKCLKPARKEVSM